MYYEMVNDIKNAFYIVKNYVKSFLPWDFNSRILMLAIALTVGFCIDRLFEINKKNKETTK